MKKKNLKKLKLEKTKVSKLEQEKLKGGRLGCSIILDDDDLKTIYPPGCW